MAAGAREKSGCRLHAGFVCGFVTLDNCTNALMNLNVTRRSLLSKMTIPVETFQRRAKDNSF